MSVSFKHIRHQGPVIAAFGRTALGALREQLRGGPRGGRGEAPGPELRQTVPPRDADLVTAYVRAVGGDPRAYRGVVPAHFFSQYAFPLLTRTMAGLSYPMARGMNYGTRLKIHAPLPADEPISLTARLAEIDDDGRRAILTQRLQVGTASVDVAFEADVLIYVPLPREADAPRREKKDKPRVPSDARELAFWRLTPRDGLDFALLTGDFNPIHWIKPAARAAGFKNTILHGFATLARAVEGLNKALWAGDPQRLDAIEVRYTRPLVLPARVGLFVTEDGGVFVGDAPGGPAYLTGTFTATGEVRS